MNKLFLHVRTWALALALSICAVAFADNSYGLKDNIQDGVILHCFDWTAAQIEEEIPSIAQAGFTAVQLSPVHQREGASAWYMAYQPYDYHIGNSIATTETLTSLCTKAHEYGVKVIVDVVANHTNGNLTYVADRLKNTNLYHDYSGGIDYGNRWQVTHGKIGMWDLKTEDATVQDIIKTYIAELKACGVDGIRWDAAKHIGLPSEGDQFWVNVPDKSMYNYGEILDSPYSGDDGTLLKEYAQYICFTDNVYGDGMASSFNSGNVPSSIGCFNQKGVDDSRLVYWGESHDTYSNDGGSSKYISQNNIDKAYAIAAGNNKATALYFSRPSATDKNAIKMGTKGSTHYTSPEVAEVNHMHNLCAGETNYYVHENGVGAQLRKTGAIFVLGSGQSGTVSIANGSGSWLTSGTYTDKVGGGKFTVTASTITGQISQSGIAVVYGDPETTDPETTTTVKVYLKNDANWNEPIYCYAYNDGATKTTGNWPGAQMTLDATTGYYTLDLTSYGLGDGAYCIFYSASGRYPGDGATGLATGGTSKVFNNSTNSWADYTDTAFEMVATCNGETVVKPLTAMRTRESGPLSTTYFAVGFKDEHLPGNAGDEVKVYVRGQNNTGAVFRPTDNTMGDSYSLLSNTDMTDFRCNTYMPMASAVNSQNAISITKGTGVSYTVALNLGDARNASTSQTANPIAYTIKANSLSLYTNKSVDDLFATMDMTKGTYKNQNIGASTQKKDLEDYYIFGSIYGTTSADATKGGYMSSADSKWTTTDGTGKTVSNYFKMEKQLFLNPNDKNVVDSIVYSKVISKPSTGYDNMYMTFAPQSLIDATSGAWGEYGKTYTATEKWNYVIRPEVFDQQDGTALRGATLVSGVEESKRRNGEQSLNPNVDNSKEYFIIRLNTTTSTYRVEFINSDEIRVGQYGIRTFCSRFNYAIPEGFAAYAAQSFEASTNTTLNGQPQGQVNLRRLKFIPANEPVVLVYNKNFSSPFDASNEAVAQEFTVITDGAGDPNKYLELENNEDWWYVSGYSDKYNNLLVACLDDVTIKNGKYHLKGNKYHYDYRHFALNLYHNTAYYKAHQTGDDYVGFFRMAGKVKAGYAYLRLTDKEMNYDGQLLGDVNSGLDSQMTSPAKFTFAFDIDPWENVTAIKKVVDKDRHDNDDAYYNLQGAKVTTPNKGVYIHNGKKVILK